MSCDGTSSGFPDTYPTCAGVCPPKTEAGPVGPQGLPGTPCTPCTNGSNAFTFTSANFVQPAVGATVTVAVLDSTWISVGQNIFIQGGGYYEVDSVQTDLSVIVKNLGTTGNVAVGSTVTSGKKVSPAGYMMPEDAMIANSLKANPTNASASPTDLAIGHNQFPARAATGNLSAKTITNFILTLCAATTAAAARTILEAAYNLITLTGTKSITGGGDLTANRTFALVNDETTPAASKYYGTNIAGDLGYHLYGELAIPVTPTRRFMQFEYKSGTSPQTNVFDTYIAQFTGKVKNLRIYFTINIDDNNYFMYVQKNGVNQVLAAIHTAGNGTAVAHTDLVNNFDVVAGDRIGFVCSATAARTVTIKVDVELLETI